VVIAVFIAIMLVIWIGILVRLLKGKLSETTEVLAVVADKQCYEKQIYSKGQAPFAKKEYIITFLCGKRKLHFEVSEFSYNGYTVDQKGILKYKGTRLIDFK
jgi:hypothetical protein